MKLLIKNMVCPRCIMAVKRILESEGLTVKSVNLGDAEITEVLTDEQRLTLSTELQQVGFELLDNPRSQLVEQIRIAVLKWVRMKSQSQKLSTYLSEHLQKTIAP